MNGSCWCPEKKRLQAKWDQLLAVGMAGDVEVGDRKENCGLLSCDPQAEHLGRADGDFGAVC